MKPILFLAQGVFAHLVRGTLRCALAWRMGALMQFTDEAVAWQMSKTEFLLAQSRASGARPGVGIPFLPTPVFTLM